VPDVEFAAQAEVVHVPVLASQAQPIATHVFVVCAAHAEDTHVLPLAEHPATEPQPGSPVHVFEFPVQTPPG
jgi:hypothetical protein